jgi:nucleoside-diphosphate-sugar epimerase
MRVAVTGATGFLGARLVASLRADGEHVQALVPVDHDPAPLSALEVDVQRGDVRDSASVRAAIDGAEVVYHLAGLVPGTSRLRTDFEAVNVRGTENVMRAARDAGVRHVVHCSTVSVHGLPAMPPADEDAPLRPSNVYGATKIEGERIVRSFSAEHGLSAVVVRPTALYGPGDVRGVRLFRDVARGLVVTIGNGASRCHLAHVADVVAGLRLAAVRRPSRGECFIVGGAEHPTVAELIALIAEAAGVRPRVLRLPALPFRLASGLRRVFRDPSRTMPGAIDRSDFFTATRTFRIERARRELGFAPRIALPAGIEETMRWYRERGLL